MPKLRVHNFTMSLDGYGAGPNQTLDEPLGVGGEQMHEWMFATKMWHDMTGQPGGETGIDDDFAQAGDRNIGATVMGRNMFGPIRGDWPDDGWKGWWGDEPPYHTPVFVLTHHARDPIPMEGGTTFYFVTDGIESALEQAYTAADGKDVRVGGGVSTVRAYMSAGLLDEAHIAISPVFLKGGESLFGGLGDVLDSYDIESVQGTRAMHITLTKK